MLFRSLLLRGDAAFAVSPDRQSARAVVGMRAGERRHLSLSYSLEGPAAIPALGPPAGERVERSVRWWRDWAARCTYRGPYREAVVRSALALKLLTYAPSGAILAAPTTSLPERIGGTRNWDYRYCWLRDASFTLRALLGLGYREEADAFFSWILHATRLTWPELQVVYSIYGEARLPERELPHLEGYAGSRPVRIGNDAHDQMQFDVYGEVLDAAVRYARAGGRFDRDGRRMLAENLAEEEGIEAGKQDHATLWLMFACGLGESEEAVRAQKLNPETEALIATFRRLSGQSYAAGLGALYAYESQFPGVASAKIEGLIDRYGISDEPTLRFFRVHESADVEHSAVCRGLLDRLPELEKAEAIAAADELAGALWNFLSGVGPAPQ